MTRSPALISSHKDFHWTLPVVPACDVFGWHEQGAGSLLLISVHVNDPRPWEAARNPVYHTGEAGWIDRESKRILGKRYRPIDDDFRPADLKVVDPIPSALDRMRKAGHDFSAQDLRWPVDEKEPGKLQARKLWARTKARLGDEFVEVHARNFSEISQCLHAEIAALFALSEKLSRKSSLPLRLDTFEMHTTLKPCRMCAAFLQQVKASCDSFDVRYDHEDPGPLAANTCLDRFGYAFHR